MKDQLIKIAQQAALLAGNHAHQQINAAITTLKTPSDAKNNEKSEIVTQFDRQCQDIIIDLIQKNFPDHGFIAEEGTPNPIFKIPPKQPDGIWWVIDPIDGTRNFARTLPQFCISIGAIQNGRPLLGVIYEPNTKTLFSAHIDGPATCNNQPITAITEPLGPNSQLAISGNIFKYIPNQAAALLDNIVYMNIGSAALHFSYVAKGAYSGAIGLNAKLWDIAGAAAIAQAAGATIHNFDGTPLFPIDPAKYQGEQLTTIFATPTIQKQIQNRLSNN